jgi:dTMP kinase
MTGKGKFIILEGVDDSALDRLAEALCRWLRGQHLEVEHTREPTYGPAGAQVLLARQGRLQFDATTLALLYLADRLDHVQHTDGIESWLGAGRHVICAHYGLAACAWLWGHVEWDWLCRIDALSRVPDLTLFIDLPARGSQQRRLQEGYRASVQKLQANSQEIAVVDGADTPDKIYLTCRKHVARLLGLEFPDLG